MSDPRPPFEIYRGDGNLRQEGSSDLAKRAPRNVEQGSYLADPHVVETVNIAIALGQPLLVTGEPGCGKTRLADSIARELQLPEPLLFATKSTSVARDVLYRYDAVGRFNDIQTKNPRAADANNYIHWEPLGEAIRASQPLLVLIDEIDKAPRDFPNDLLTELDRMWMEVPELARPEPGSKAHRFEATVRPIVIITSNSERDLPAPFLRRCVFCAIEFPKKEKLIEIVEQRLKHVALDASLVKSAVKRFEAVRETPNLSRKPATAELLSWIEVLHAQRCKPGDLDGGKLPAWQVLIKDATDAVQFRPEPA